MHASVFPFLQIKTTNVLLYLWKKWRILLPVFFISTVPLGDKVCADKKVPHTPCTTTTQQSYLSIQRDPFIRPQDELQQPIESTTPPSPLLQDAGKIDQWRLQGVIGHVEDHFCAIVHSPNGQWHLLFQGDKIAQYQVTEIGMAYLILQLLPQKYQYPAQPQTLLLKINHHAHQEVT